jgi:[acyl-carrier-protein] S-malonyltransferase
MGWELYRDLPSCRRIFEEADEKLQRPLTRLIFEGRADEVRATENLQPAISAVNAACLEGLRERGLEPVAVAGHSLGEYAACYAAGVFTFAELMRLTSERGRFMAAASLAKPGGMLAVHGLSEARVAAIVEEASSVGTVCLANANTDDQFVLSGEPAALARAADLARSTGAQRLTPLNVNGAWHSPLMSESRLDFEKVLHGVVFQQASVDIYQNVTAEPERVGAVLRARLAAQYDSKVRWCETMRNMMRDRPNAQFVEVGPGRVLTGLVLSIDRRRRVNHVDSPTALDALIRRSSAAG